MAVENKTCKNPICRCAPQPDGFRGCTTSWMRLSFVAIFLSLNFLATVIVVHAQPWHQATPANFFTLPTGGETHVRYYATHPLDRPQPQITRAVINIHGGARRASAYFEAVGRGAQIAGVTESCLILTPQFRLTEDKPAERELWWDHDGDWKVGIDSTGKITHRVSSFAIADLLLTELADRRRFPNLRMIVLTGHSSGGQFTQRYAVSSGAPDKLPPSVRMRFVVANPSSYFYFRPERVRPGTRYEFWIPPSDAKETKYHAYKHGLLEPPPYFKDADWNAWAARYRQRDVIYLLGTDDVYTMHTGLDISPGGQPRDRTASSVVAISWLTCTRFTRRTIICSSRFLPSGMKGIACSPPQPEFERFTMSSPMSAASRMEWRQNPTVHRSDFFFQ